jgi:PAS domain S-box-containing protein
MRRDVEALQDQLLQSVGEAIIATDLNGIVTYWNPAAERMYGWTAAEALGLPVGELLTADGHADEAAAIWEALRSGLSWSGRFTVRRRDGSTFPAQVTDAPIVDSSGTLVGVIGISLDVSEREATSRRLYRLAAVVEAMRDGVVLVDLPQATVSYVNETARRLLHEDVAAALGRPI